MVGRRADFLPRACMRHYAVSSVTRFCHAAELTLACGGVVNKIIDTQGKELGHGVGHAKRARATNRLMCSRHAALLQVLAPPV